MRRFAKIVSLSAAGVLLLVVAVGWWIVSGQLARDRECSRSLQRVVQHIEAYRAKHGQLPDVTELSKLGVSRGDYVVTSDAQGRKVYRLRQWRGEWFVHFDSVSGTDTCDSGAWKGGLWLAGTLLPLAAALIWWGRRRGE